MFRAFKRFKFVKILNLRLQFYLFGRLDVTSHMPAAAPDYQWLRAWEHMNMPAAPTVFCSIQKTAGPDFKLQDHL